MPDQLGAHLGNEFPYAIKCGNAMAGEVHVYWMLGLLHAGCYVRHVSPVIPGKMVMDLKSWQTHNLQNTKQAGEGLLLKRLIELMHCKPIHRAHGMPTMDTIRDS